MTGYAIRVEGLCKEYIIGGREQGYRTLRESLVDALGAPLRRLRAIGREPSPEERFWALKDVSFDVKPGEVVGIIGRNGAGKSTLLKVLSRITAPTRGRVEIRGRVASLLEVGTGFHPELTGRENIYLNGAILGMPRAEIRRKFDEIVAFAEIEKFLDTPVKRYSSGMYVRLAFAVAAHLEPDTLLVDEVLAVGDAEFQKKCLSKMQDVAGRGRTVLFVSHNLGAVTSLCTRGMLLVAGGMCRNGTIDDAISHYLGAATADYEMTYNPDPTRPAIVGVRVDAGALRSRNLVVDICFASPTPLPIAVGGVVLRNMSGDPLWGSNSRFHPYPIPMKNTATGTLRCEARNLPLVPGQYVMSVWLADWHENHDSKLDAITITLGTERTDLLRPPAPLIGPLDWPASWVPLQGPEATADRH